MPPDSSSPPLLWSEPRRDTEIDFWRKIPQWKDVSSDQFLSWQWGIRVNIPFFVDVMY